MLDLLQLPKHAAVMLSGSALSSLIRSRTCSAYPSVSAAPASEGAGTGGPLKGHGRLQWRLIV